jgi:hypothetical protein
MIEQSDYLPKEWITEVIDELKRKGLTEELLQDADQALTEVIAGRVLELHWPEIQANEQMAQALIFDALLNARPETLREYAERARERDQMDLAYTLEEVADEKERWQ